MTRQNTRGFNKEKMVFLIISVFCAIGIYLFLASGPVLLQVGDPIAAQDAPDALKGGLESDKAQDVDYYVVDGEKTGYRDVRTNQLVNRKRKNPFEPPSGWREAKAPVEVAVAKLAPPPPPPPPPPAALKEQKMGPKGANFDGKDLAAQVKFMGVVTMNGQTVGLLKPIEEDGEPRRVKVGDKIPDYNYTVTKIENQAIWVTDADNHPFVLKDTDLLGGGDNSDSADKPAKAAKPEAMDTPDGPAADPKAKMARGPAGKAASKLGAGANNDGPPKSHLRRPRDRANPEAPR